MFQTEIIIFLQSFASDFLTAFFKFFTEIGKSTYAAPFILIVMFGISFRIGFILLHAVSWNGLITFYFKELFSLPRPLNVDLHVQSLGESFSNPTPLESMGAENFFGGIPKDAVEFFRSNPFDSWGFPSGHASHAVTLWGSISLCVKKKWLSISAVMMIVIITLSRMYLGRHFLADVLGGLLLGFLVTLIFCRGIYLSNPIMSFMFERKKKVRMSMGSIVFYFYFLFVPFLVLFIPGILIDQVGALLGLNLGFIWIRYRGFPDDTGSILQRIGRVLLAVAIFFLFYVGLKKGTGIVFPSEPVVVEFIRLVFNMFISLSVSVEINRRLGLYRG